MALPQTATPLVMTHLHHTPVHFHQSGQKEKGQTISRLERRPACRVTILPAPMRTAGARAMEYKGQEELVQTLWTSSPILQPRADLARACDEIPIPQLRARS